MSDTLLEPLYTTLPVNRRHACRDCGCTEERACEGGCFWVLDRLCSQCARCQTCGAKGVARALRVELRKRTGFLVVPLCVLHETELSPATDDPKLDRWHYLGVFSSDAEEIAIARRDAGIPD